MTSEESFRCVHCKERVAADVFGTAHRNHCPRCLWSRHLDDFPGDRKSSCKSGMEPAAVTVRSDGEWAIIHRCAGCAVLHENRIAGDDNVMVLMALAARPLARPPIPLEYLS
ncbi:MAG TPA: RNHCP domain-containing protein [Tepidiformaceae bacterium]|nr:RNHCP domain-containing protein [Tepidiformaceae bacterium]